MDLCIYAERILGPMISKLWWDYDGVDAKGMWTATQDAKWMEGEEDTDGTETEMD